MNEGRGSVKTYHLRIPSYVYSNTWEGGFIISLKQKKILSPTPFKRANNYFLLPGTYVLVKSEGYLDHRGYYVVQVSLIKIEKQQTKVVCKYINTIHDVHKSKKPIFQKIIKALDDMKKEYHTIPSPPIIEFSLRDTRELLFFLKKGGDE